MEYKAANRLKNHIVPSKEELNWPLVSINIPTYNQEKYIARAIQSCLEQDYPNKEIIVSDDCSTDNTYAIAASYASDIVSVNRTKENLGRVGNYRHVLYQLSNGDWVVNLDGDDYYNEPSFISEAITLLISNPSAIMYAAGAASINEETGITTRSPILLNDNITIVNGADYVLNFYKWGQIGQHFSVLYNRKAALETNFYTLDSLGADTDSICRLALKGEVIIHKKYVGVWTSHRANASYSLRLDNVHKEFRTLESIATAAYSYLPNEKVAGWLKEAKGMKYRQSMYATLPHMSWHKGFSLLLKNWTWELQSFKEAIKVFLRLLN